MKFTADKGQVMEIYCSWLKDNCDRYEYLTGKAEELHQKIKGMEIGSEEAKEYYLAFLAMFMNNPFMRASALWQSGAYQAENGEEQITSGDYRCYFMKNQFGMWLPLELYCQLASYRSDSEQEAVQDQEQQKLSGDYQAYVSLSDYLERSWEIEETDRKEKFSRFLKGPEEIRLHPVMAALLLAAAGFLLWKLYMAFAPGGFEAFRFMGKPYLALTAVGVFLLLFVAVKSVREFISFFKKDGVRSSVKQLDSLEKEILQNAKKAGEMTGDLRDFVYQMLKSGKKGVSDPLLLKKGNVPGGAAAYGKREPMVSRLEQAETAVRSYVKIRYFPLLLVLSVLLNTFGIIHIGSFGGVSFLPAKEEEETTTASAEETEGLQEEKWLVTAPECPLYDSPGGDSTAVLNQGDQLEVLGRDDSGRWLYVSAPDGSEGYVDRVSVIRAMSGEVMVGQAWATSECADGETMYASYAFDGNLATSWQEGAEGYGIGEILAASFAQSQVKEVLLVNGNVSSEESYYRNGRVKLITVYVPDTSYEWSFEIPDEYNLEGTELVFDEPVTAEVLAFRIDEVYEGEVYQDTCISEIRIFGQR